MPLGLDSAKSSTFLNEKLCFELWNDLGSVTKMHNAIREMEITNPVTGGYPTRRGVEVAAIRYMARNITAARQAVVDAGGVWFEDWFTYLAWLYRRVIAGNILGAREVGRFVQDVRRLAVRHLSGDEQSSFFSLIENDDALDDWVRRLGDDDFKTDETYEE